MFGYYDEAHYDLTVTNYMNPRNHVVIALGSTVNKQVSLVVFYIYTRKFLKRGKTITILMLNNMIKRLNDWVMWL